MSRMKKLRIENRTSFWFATSSSSRLDTLVIFIITKLNSRRQEVYSIRSIYRVYYFFLKIFCFFGKFFWTSSDVTRSMCTLLESPSKIDGVISVRSTSRSRGKRIMMARAPRKPHVRIISQAQARWHNEKSDSRHKLGPVARKSDRARSPREYSSISCLVVQWQGWERRGERTRFRAISAKKERPRRYIMLYVLGAASSDPWNAFRFYDQFFHILNLLIWIVICIAIIC